MYIEPGANLTRKELGPSREDRGVRQFVLVLATMCVRNSFKSVKVVFTATWTLFKHRHIAHTHMQ